MTGRKLTKAEVEILSDELTYLQKIGAHPLDVAIEYAEMVRDHLKALDLPKTRLKPINTVIKRAKKQWPSFILEMPIDEYPAEYVMEREQELESLLDAIIERLQEGVVHLSNRFR